MRPGRTPFRALVAVLVVAAGLGASSLAWGADTDIRGVIIGRGENGSVIVQTDSARLTVVMSDATRIRRIDGIRPVIVSSADLIPGLRIKAEGALDTDTLTASKITFSREDFKIAAAIQGGIIPTDQRSLENEHNIQEHTQELTAQKAAIGQQAQQLATTNGRIAADEQKMVATAGAINARISNLDDFTPLKTITVLFRNGKYDISNSDRAMLEQFATEARATSGYMIQVKAFASAVGPYQLNQRLSLERANRVTQILQQSGVPPTNVFVPAGMGVTEQVATNKTRQGQAENRRAVVTLLQNKGLQSGN
jgi:outer membrane protein OmpA-like peptidoglycan-associated protein